MWTADAETYARVFVEMLDWHLRLADETSANPPAFRHRFNCDGSEWLRAYEQRKSPAEFARLIERVRDGTISAPLNALVSCYGGQPTEAVLRGMYYAGRLERKYGIRFTQAIAMENQTLPLGLASLWAGAGAKYSWKGVCGCASRMDAAALAKREHEIYWATGLDGRRVLMKWHSLAPGGNKGSGGYAEAFDPAAAVTLLDSDADFLSRYRAPGAAEPYSVRGAFGFGWDALDRKTGQPYAADAKSYPVADHFHIVAERETTPTRQVIVSNQENFFRDFEAKHGAQLPAQSVTFGNEWDLYSASMAETSARVRRAVEKLRAAEAMATLVCLRKPDFMRAREAARDRAFINLGLYWEHNWTADGPVTREARAAWQEKLAGEIEAYVNALHTDAAAELGKLISRSGEAPRFFVFNPLGWTRTDAADFAYAGSEDIHVHDLAAAADVPHQFVTIDGVKCLRILASDVPPIGYKAFEIRPGAGNAPSGAAARIEAASFENERVKIVVEPDGAIASLIDKAHPDTELAASIDGLALNDFAANDAIGTVVVVENSGPVSATLKCVSDAGVPHTTRVTLFRDSDRVEIHNEITANFADVRHWAFSFNLTQPDVHTEEVGAIIRVKRKPDGGDYADRNARYDCATLNHFADITDGANTRGVTLSNSDCAFVKLGRSTPVALDTATAQLNVLAGGQVDGDKLGIRNQNGATHFLQRFALRPHGAYDQTAAMKFALEHQNPFVTGAIVGKADSAYPEATHSLLTVSNPDVLLWALKPHDDGIKHGVVARLWNVSEAEANAELTFALGLSAAHRATHLETDIEAAPLNSSGTLRTAFKRQQIQTYRLQVK